MILRKSLGIILTMLAVLSAAPAEASKRSQANDLEFRTAKYGSYIRWNEFELAWAYVDPEFRKENPLSNLDKERLKQIEVTGYEEKTQDVLADGTVEITAQIRLININTGAERKVIDTQHWRWDALAKRWWQISGLPDFNAKSF